MLAQRTKSLLDELALFEISLPLSGSRSSEDRPDNARAQQPPHHMVLIGKGGYKPDL
jgi:hypothetical protein